MQDTAIRVTDLEQEIRHLRELVTNLSLQVRQLQTPDANLVWMSVGDAAKHPQIKGRLSIKQIRDRVTKSIDDPVTASLIPNVHFQIISDNDTRTRYRVNAIELAKWLEQRSASRY